MKQFGKRKICNNILVPGHLGTDKVFDLARRHFYWPKMYRDTELDITKQCQCIKRKKT